MVNKSPKYNLFRLLVIIVIGIVISFIATGAVVILWPQNNLNSSVKINISKGSTLRQISNMLVEKEIVSNQNMFITSAKLMGQANKIPAGIFVLDDAKNNYQIVKKLIQGHPKSIRVTLLEGWTLPQVAQIIADSMKYSSEKFIVLCHDEKFIGELGINANSLEGYLYPDTYLFLEGENEPKEIIKQIIAEFKFNYSEELIKRAVQMKFTTNEILTLASIIENEAIYDSERAIISAVYHNRLKIGMPLQADPTIQYLIKDSPRRLRLSDLKIDSPYNTYLNNGLPPGPISNPGKASILAALYPEENDFIFFVARGDGYHVFTRTLEEHNQSKLEFQKIRQLAAQS